MKVMRIGIQSFSEGLGDFAEAFEAARSRKALKTSEGTYFTSLQAARNFLTPKRLELLRLIKAAEPHSVYALAKLARRDFAGVQRDLQLLRRHGLVNLADGSAARRRASRPSVPFDEIQLSIPLSRKAPGPTPRA